MFKMNYLVLLLVVASVDKIASEENCTVTGTCPEGDTCKKGNIFNSDKTNCLPYATEYNGTCSEDAQCKDWLGENSVCKYVCVCKDGYRWFQGECKGYVGLGETCTDASDCFDGYNLQSFSCVDGKCSCTEGYYQRGDIDCRKKASNEGDICALDVDCQFENGSCVKGICSTSEKLGLLEEIIEQTVSNSQLDEQTPCESDENCSDIPNSECYEKTGTCVCKKTYFFNDEGTECIPELGVFTNCKDNSDCKIKPGKCEDGICYCRDYYVVDRSNRKCVKTMSQQNWNCLTNEWCYALGKYSFCSSSGTCNCSKGFDYNKTNAVCDSNGQNGTDTDVCTEDYDCKDIPNSHCIDQVCQCQEHYEWKDDMCVKRDSEIGFPCSDASDCQIENAKCISKTCQCLENYFPSTQNKTCYEIKHQLGEDCEIDLQCSLGVLYSRCGNGTCECNENYLSHDDYCYEKKEYNSYCNNLIECTLSLGDNFQCRNRMCQCPTGYGKKEDGCSSSIIKSGNFFVLAFVLILKGVFSVFC